MDLYVLKKIVVAGGLVYHRGVKTSPGLDKIKTAKLRPLIEGVIDMQPLQKVPGTFMHGYFSTKLSCAWTGIDGTIADTSNDLTERRDPRCKALSIIVLTVEARRGDHTKHLVAGASDDISKPVDTGSLLSLLCN